MIEDGRDANSPSEGAGASAEADEISTFDAASYVFQIAGELSVMSKHKGLGRVAEGLERVVRNAAAQAMLDERRKASPHSES
jgi:hypothetical protein